MRKILSFLLALCLLVTLTACGSTSVTLPDETREPTTPATEEIGETTPPAAESSDGESGEDAASQEPLEQEKEVPDDTQNTSPADTQPPAAEPGQETQETLPVSSAAEPETQPAATAPSTTVSAAQTEESTPAPKQPKILIAYFTWADNTYVEDPSTVDPTIDAPSSASILPPGDTARIGGWIQQEIGGTLHSIITAEAYSSDYDECLDRAIEEHDDGIRPALSSSVSNMADYDIVFLGYPNWWYTSPMCIRTFLEEYEFIGKTIIPFCTTMGAGIGQSVGEIKELCPEATVLDGLTLSTERDNEEKSRSG